MKSVLVLLVTIALAISLAGAADHSVLVWNLSPSSVDVTFGTAPSFSVDSGKWHTFVANMSSYTVVINATVTASQNFTINDNSTLVIYNSTFESLLLKNSVPTLQAATAHARFFHDASAVAGVDVYFGVQQVASNLTFSKASDYVAVPYGTVNLVLHPTGDMNTTLLNTTFQVNDGQVVSVSLSDALAALVLPENDAATAAIQLSVFSTAADLALWLDGRSDVFAQLPAYAQLDTPVLQVVAGVKHNLTLLSNGSQLTSVQLSFDAAAQYHVLLTSGRIVAVQDNAVQPDLAYHARVTYLNLAASLVHFSLNDSVHHMVFAEDVAPYTVTYVYPNGKPYGPFTLQLNGTLQNATANLDYPTALDPNSGYTLIAYTAADGSLAAVQYRDYVGPVQQVVFFRLIHSVPDAGAVDLYVNGSLEIANVRYGGAAGVSAYENATLLLNDEDVELTLRPHGDNVTVLASASVHFDLYTNYSIVAWGSAHGALNGSVPQGVSLLQLVDDNTYVEDQPKVRFVHLVADYAGPVNVTVGPESPAALANTQSLKSSSYVELSKSGKMVVTVQLAGGNLTLSTKATLDEGSVYTVAVQGWAAAQNLTLFVVRDLQGGDIEQGLTTLELFLLIGGGILFAIMLLTIIVFAIRSRGPEGGYEQLPN